MDPAYIQTGHSANQIPRV